MSIREPQVSILVLACNQEAYVEQAVRSALEQDYPNIEIIVSDDCSDDGTFDVIRKVVEGSKLDVVVNRNVRRLGLAAHINYLISLSKAPFICWLAGDDIAFVNKVRELVSPMVADPDVFGVHSAVIEISPAGEQLRVRRHASPELLTSASEVIRHDLSVASQSHAFRREAFSRFGDFSSELTHEGRVMAFRELMLGKIVYIETPLTYYRVNVGISTTRGRTAVERVRSEPVKYCLWRSTALSQIRKDIDGRDDVEDALREGVESKYREYADLLKVTRDPWSLGSLLRGIAKHHRAFDFSKAFIRRNFPMCLVDAYYTRGA